MMASVGTVPVGVGSLTTAPFAQGAPERCIVTPAHSGSSVPDWLRVSGPYFEQFDISLKFGELPANTPSTLTRTGTSIFDTLSYNNNNNYYYLHMNLTG